MNNMIEEQPNLVLEYLRAMRGDIASVCEDIAYLKHGFIGIRNDLHGFWGDMLRLETRTEERLDKIEKRLGLSEIVQ